MIELIIHGHTGRLGKRLIDNLLNNSDIYNNINYISHVDRSYNFDFYDPNNYKNLVIVDVSSDIGCKNLLTQLTDKGIYHPLIIGTTGDLPQELIKNYSKYAPVCIVSNFSDGMRSILNFVNTVNIPNSKTSLIETHHIHKKDAPSGTAKSIANKIDFDHKEIQSIREGNVFGIHEVIFENEYEKIVIKHEVKDHNIFAIGCLKFVENIINLSKGLYVY
jgi:4-hydroxy-tetrahydrodipicolinate reductase